MGLCTILNEDIAHAEARCIGVNDKNRCGITLRNPIGRLEVEIGSSTVYVRARRIELRFSDINGIQKVAAVHSARGSVAHTENIRVKIGNR